MLSPLGVHVCERVHEHYLYVCMWHTSALHVTTQQQALSQMKKLSVNTEGKQISQPESVYDKALLSFTHHQLKKRQILKMDV